MSACSSSDDTGASGGAANQAGAGNASSGGSSSSGDVEPPEQSGMTAAHNAVRANVRPAANPAIPPLVWSGAVAATAQAWADHCTFEHSGGKFGENIYATAGAPSSPAKVVGSWADEAEQYDYASNSCTDVCGHYTQVVWRNSARLGCGVSNCTKNSPFSGFSQWQFWVCNYDPPGNFNNQKPY